MFYSETLLAKTGPLARVWLAANLERKLTKQNVLSSNLENNVKDIIGQGQAPMALRLSGHLLLGVVKIYSKKAKYLLDDCSEALNRIRVAFKPGNVDLPSNQTHTANPSTLLLPDAVAEIDLFAPIQGPEHLLLDGPNGFGAGAGLDDSTFLTDASQLLPATQTPRRQQRPTFNLDEQDDLGLEIGEFDPGTFNATSLTVDRSIEVGRRAQTPKLDEPTLLDDDLGLYIGEGESTVHDMPDDDDMIMPDADDAFEPPALDDDIAAQNNAAFARVEAAEERRMRDSVSPLSTIRSSAERELERSFRPNLNAEDDEEDATMMQAAQRVKRRKVMQQDAETQLHNSQIKKQQEDRSTITRAPHFLSRDPILLQLMELQRSGSFVSNIMGDGRMAGWAPELRGILSLEVVIRSPEKKRKRDSGIADVETGSERQDATPELEIPVDHDDNDAAADFPTAFPSDGLRGATPEDEAFADDAGAFDEDNDEASAIPFDITEAPLLHPSQSGPISVGTKNTVHALRSFFAPNHPSTVASPPSSSSRVNATARFTDLCPEPSTTRTDATKMFFELLVLGTKDAVKVEQDSRDLGLPIRVRAKRGLWGQWAEQGAIPADEGSQAVRRPGLLADDEDGEE